MKVAKTVYIILGTIHIFKKMAKLINKTFGENKFSTFEILGIIIGAPRAEGYSISELQDIFELRKLIENSSNEIQLKENQVKQIKDFVKKHRFGKFDMAFIEFANHIEAL